MATVEPYGFRQGTAYKVDGDHILTEKTLGDPLGMQPAKRLIKAMLSLSPEDLANSDAWVAPLGSQVIDSPRARVEIPHRVQVFAGQFQAGEDKAVAISAFIDAHMLPADTTPEAGAARLIAKGLMYDSVLVKNTPVDSMLTQDRAKATEAFVVTAISKYPDEKEGASHNSAGVRVAAYMVMEHCKALFAEPTLPERVSYRARRAAAGVQTFFDNTIAPNLPK